MVSPLTKALDIDKKAIVNIVNSFIDSCVIPFVLGTTGESPSLSFKQKNELVRATVAAVNGREIVVAGIIGNSLPESIDEGNRYADYGVDAVVATVPNYYPFDSSQMKKYLTKVAGSVRCPVILYNTPATNHRSIPVGVIDELSFHPNIAGVKDSERSGERLDRSLNLWKGREDFIFLVGWAAMSVYGLLNGAAGIVPSTGNFVPQLYRRLIDAVKENKLQEANELQEKTDRISSWYQAGRDLSRSIPALKQIMALKNLCHEYVMPPMYEMDNEEKNSFVSKIKNQLQKLDV